ncbi:MAG: proline dehydrogenase family protein [Elusimicrobiota bacterium]
MLLFAKRFVAGETKQEAIARASQLQKQGFRYTLDFLGEHIKSPVEAAAVAQEYESLLACLLERVMPLSVSVKLTHLGLDIDEQTTLANMRRLLSMTARHGGFVRVDMEGSIYTEATLRVFKALHREFAEHVGIVIQAYLHRSAADVDEMNALGASVRLCKGAYKEPATLAIASRVDIDANFDRLSNKLLERGRHPAIATHDRARIASALESAKRYGKKDSDFEFQMLLGVRGALSRELLAQGHRVRLYLPYGREWLGYFYRRVRERKENLLFAVRSVLGG